jgi:hypothetical protein
MYLALFTTTIIQPLLDILTPDVTNQVVKAVRISQARLANEINKVNSGPGTTTTQNPGKYLQPNMRYFVSLIDCITDPLYLVPIMKTIINMSSEIKKIFIENAKTILLHFGDGDLFADEGDGIGYRMIQMFVTRDCFTNSKLILVVLEEISKIRDPALFDMSTSTEERKYLFDAFKTSATDDSVRRNIRDSLNTPGAYERFFMMSMLLVLIACVEQRPEIKADLKRVKTRYEEILSEKHEVWMVPVPKNDMPLNRRDVTTVLSTALHPSTYKIHNALSNGKGFMSCLSTTTPSHDDRESIVLLLRAQDNLRRVNSELVSMEDTSTAERTRLSNLVRVLLTDISRLQGIISAQGIVMPMRANQFSGGTSSDGTSSNEISSDTRGDINGTDEDSSGI